MKKGLSFEFVSAPLGNERARTGRASARHDGCRAICALYIAPPARSVPASPRNADASLVLDVVKNHRCGPS